MTPRMRSPRAKAPCVLPALFKAHGIEVLDMLTYRTKDTDYSAQVTKAKSLGAEGIGLGACYQNAAAIAKEMAKQGLNVPVVGGACAGAPGFIEIAGKAAEGAYMSTAAWIDDPRPEVQAYVKKIIAEDRRPSRPIAARAPTTSSIPTNTASRNPASPTSRPISIPTATRCATASAA